ncbi:MAG: ABC transporter permease, partial [Oscillospiraceae bacterium]|nr:ABC transporter permease [Oscillospiraceae bacterium]
MKLHEITAKYLKGQKKHTIMTITAVTVSVAFLTVLLCTLSIYKASDLAVVRKNGTYHVVFNGLTKDELLTIRNMDIWSETQNYGISGYSSRTDIDFDAYKENADIEYLCRSGNLMDTTFLRMDGTPDMLPMSMYTTREGRLPEKDGEIALSYDQSYMWGYPNVGDTVTAILITCGSSDREDAPQYKDGIWYDVTDEQIQNGVEGDVNGWYVPPQLSDAMSIQDAKEISFTVVGFTSEYNFVTYDDTRLRAYSSNKDQLLCRYISTMSDAYWDMETAFARAGMEIDDFDYGLNEDLLNAEDLGTDAKFNTAKFFALMYLFIIFIMFCARLVIDDSFEISAKERIKQFGLLKAVGASKKQIFSMLVTEAVYLAIPGIVMGLLLGLGLARLIFDMIVRTAVGGSGKYDVGNMVFEIRPYVYVSAVVLGLLWVMISAVATGMRSIKSTPVEALRSAGRQDAVRIPKKPSAISRGGAFIPAYASLSVKRNTKRFVITIVSMVMSISLFAGFSYGVYLLNEGTVNRFSVLREPYGYEVAYSSTDPTSVFSVSDIIDAGEDKFTAVTAWSRFLVYADKADMGSQSFRGESCLLNIIPVSRSEYEAHIRTDITYDELDRGGLLLCRSICDENYKYLYDIYPSAPTVFKGKYFSSQHISFGDDCSFDVKGIYTTDRRTFMGKNTQPAAIVTYGTYIHMLEEKGTDDNTTVTVAEDGTEYKVYNSKLLLSADDDIWAKNYLDKYFFGQYTNNSGDRADAQMLLRIIELAGYFVITIISIIAVINIVNIISANVLNRTSELAMLRACGMSDKQIYTLLFRESTIYAGLSGIISAVLIELAIFAVQIP